MNEQAQQCDDSQLVALLQDEDLIPQPSLVAHIESCGRCRAWLQALAGTDDDWRRAETALSSASDDTSSIEFDAEWASRTRTACWSQHSAKWTEALIQPILDPPSHPELLGRLGRYDIESLIGYGGMGVVFKAHDSELNRAVAIKILAPQLAANDSARERFAQEASAAAGVVDDHVVPIHNVETDYKVPFLVMQYIAGGSLQARLDREGPLGVADVLRIGMQTARGLDAAHAQGLIHRDVKPSNILLDEGVERALLSDFGLARVEGGNGLTRTGFHPGTPHYMSPEQVRGEDIDHRSDLFSLGCVLYSLCTGHPPFQADTGFAVLRGITDETTPSIRELNNSVPKWLERIVVRLLSKSPDDRYQSAYEVAELLEECLAHVRQPNSAPLPEMGEPTGVRRIIVHFGLVFGTIASVAVVCGFAFGLLTMPIQSSAPILRSQPTPSMVEIDDEIEDGEESIALEFQLEQFDTDLAEFESELGISSRPRRRAN